MGFSHPTLPLSFSQIFQIPSSRTGRGGGSRERPRSAYARVRPLDPPNPVSHPPSSPLKTGCFLLSPSLPKNHFLQGHVRGWGFLRRNKRTGEGGERPTSPSRLSNICDAYPGRGRKRARRAMQPSRNVTGLCVCAWPGRPWGGQAGIFPPAVRIRPVGQRREGQREREQAI